MAGFILDKKAGYFKNGGVDVMAFDDIYPAGHQSGVSVIMHSKRIATNGDVRFEPTPGQWQPLPVQGERVLDEGENSIVTRLSYPNANAHLKGFNPMIYPDLALSYSVKVTGDGDGVNVSVCLDTPIPESYRGKLCFNLELFPGELFGKTWIMDGKSGIFPRQPNGPVLERESSYLNTLPAVEGGASKEKLTGKGYSPIIADDMIALPYCSGRRFVLCPDDDSLRMVIESSETISLYDGRMNHNNGWFALSSVLPAGITGTALTWKITPHAIPDWTYSPVIQVSQVGYHPAQPKIACIELDKSCTACETAALMRIGENGEEAVYSATVADWGCFLRYSYRQFDFSHIKEEGLYCVRYASCRSAVFRIAEDVYDRGVWQPVLEYFLPVQMCHMRVNEKYRVWHGLCHSDDARMAPVSYNHIDGYVQGPSTLTKYKPGEHVPGLDYGGWHDAGDFDLRIESQSGEVYNLSCAFEEFNVYWDTTTVNQVNRITEIHQPDGRNDILEQIEHGLLTILGGWKALGRLYRGIICNDLRQYVLLGDAAAMTDGVPGNDDDRWVFTEDNPPRELSVAAHLAAASRAMRGFNDELSAEALEVAQELFKRTDKSGRAISPAIHAACELLKTTNLEEYRSFILENAEFILSHIDSTAWFVSRAIGEIGDKAFEDLFRSGLLTYRDRLNALSSETPYGIPYHPHIWGAGWDIQGQGFRYWFLRKAYPDIFPADMLASALNFVLGCHPGSNTASFASGVGAKSATTAYGLNRADWSYIPGGVISGTALIRPDFPELLTFPFLWQQTEYVIGGGSSNYMFLVLAVIASYKKNGVVSQPPIEIYPADIF